MEKKHRVLIAEDQHLLRSGLCTLVSSLHDYTIAGEATDGLEVCRLASALMPDLILMDLSMPCRSGIEAIAVIKRQLYDVPFQTLAEATIDANREMVVALRGSDFREGVASFMEKRPPRFTGK